MSNPATIEITAEELLPMRQQSDVIQLTNRIRQEAQRVGMNTFSQTKLSTAASELARNMLMYGGGGNVQFQCIRSGARHGIRLFFMDQGPGIVDVHQAMETGYSTGVGMGLGLPGAKRLADDFSLTSVVGEGTTVMILKWAND